MDVHVSQDVGQVFEAPKISSQDRNLQCTVGQILDVLLLEKAERLVEVPETVSRDRLQQRTVEEIVDAPVPQAKEELAEVFKVFSQDRIQQRTVVSYTSNLLEQMCDCRKHIMFTPKWISNLQDLPRSQSPETVPICIV